MMWDFSECVIVIVIVIVIAVSLCAPLPVLTGLCFGMCGDYRTFFCVGSGDVCRVCRELDQLS